ncbi:MAG: hypothetical protein ACOH2L_04525 [Devosia sp.]
MTHQGADDPHRHGELTDIIARDDQPGLLRQLGNGVGGMIVLLLTGLVLIVAVLWKSP